MELLLLSVSLMFTAVNSHVPPTSSNLQETEKSPKDIASIPSLTPKDWIQFQQEQPQRQRSYSREVGTRNAQLRASERRRRLATLKAYGYSKSRPVVAHTPFTSFYAPHWIGIRSER